MPRERDVTTVLRAYKLASGSFARLVATPP
jgi:hypothetical protein